MAIKIKKLQSTANPFPEIADPFGYGQRAVDYLRSLKHPKSRLKGARFELDPWQEKIVRQIYGPCDDKGRRVVRQVALLIPRGNRKTSLGAALANQKHGRFTVAFGGDGDFMYNPGALWTAAHHKIPILYIVQNNRAYHQEYMYLTAMAVRHGRGVDQMDIGTTLNEPNIDYATVARGMGVHGEGPITDPNDLGPALARAIAVVRSGEPAVVDVVTEPR